MGIARSLGKFFGGFLFSTFLFLTLLMIALIQFTEYQTLKNVMVPLLAQQISHQITLEQTETLYRILVSSCQQRDTSELQIGEFNVTVDCKNIISLTPTNFSTVISTSLFDFVYYKNYTCDFISCLQKGKENPLVIFSLHANNFFQKMFNYAVILTTLGFVLILISTINWNIRFRFLGWSIAFAITPLFLFHYIENFLIPKNIPIPASINLSAIVDKIFESIKIYATVLLILGIILLLVGYLARKKKTKKL